jgi:hypothetical protein
MYSLMSMVITASSEPNMNFASCLQRYVLPTPDGPRNTNEPIGRRGSFRPERERRTARAIALIASSWWMTTLPSSLSIASKRSASAFSRRVSGMPVIFDTVSAMTSAVTSPVSSFEACSARHSFCISSFFLRSW